MPKMTIKHCRLAFPSIFATSSVGDGEPAYGARFIINPKDTAQVKALDDAMLAAAKEKWDAKAETILKQLIKDGKTCFSKDTYTNKDGEPFSGFEGMYHLGARNGGKTPLKPSTFNNQNAATTQDDGLIYGGAYVDASVEIYAQDNTFGRRINCSLRGVRFVAHGESFGGGSKATADDFGDPVEVEAEEFV